MATIMGIPQRLKGHVGVLVASMLGFGAISVYLGKDMNPDLYLYHYYTPYALLHDRVMIDYAPAHLQSYLNPVLDLPFYGLSWLLPDRAVGFAMGALHGLNLWLVFRITVLLLRPYEAALGQRSTYLLALACSVASMYSSIVMGNLGNTMNDLHCSIFVLAALYCLLRYLEEGTRLWILMLSGFWLGFAVGAKLTAGVFAPPLALVLVLNWRRLPAKTRALLSFGVCGAIGFLAANGYWMHVLYKRFGNPIFPFFNGVFRSDYWPWTNFRDTTYAVHDIKQAILFPYNVLRHPELTGVDFFDMRMLLALVLLVVVLAVSVLRIVLPLLAGRPRFTGREYRSRLLVLVGRPPSTGSEDRGRLPDTSTSDRQFPAVALMVFFAGSYVIWLKQFALWRYMATLELLAPTVILAAFLILLRRSKVAAVATLLCLVPVVVTMRPAAWDRGTWTGGRFFQVRPPALNQSENILAIMVGKEVYSCSHVIPFFRGNVRFVRIESNLDDFRENQNGKMVDTKFQQEVRQVVGEHSGPIYLLAGKRDRNMSAKLLEEYHLQEVPGPSILVDPMSGDVDLQIEWVQLTRIAS
jgi:hypothetical protein